MFIKKLLILILIFICYLPGIYASDQAENNSGTLSLDSWEHLNALVAAINSTRIELDEKRAELRNSVDETERKQLSEELERISQDQKSLQTALEMLATGAADLTLFGVKTEEKFDWREELQSVFEPILVELRRLSERPRKIERLRNDQIYYQDRLNVAEPALKSVSDYLKNAPTSELQQEFSRLEERWRKRRDDLKNRLALVEFELQETLSPSKANKQDPKEVLKNILGGRVLNLLMAATVMAIVYILLRIIARFYQRMVMQKKGRTPSVFARIGNLLFYALTTLVVLLSGISVLYIRGDWVLLGLLFIVLAGVALALQKSLPNYMTEAKLILNLGAVREGEKIIYNQLPWQVQTLNFYAILHNPLLIGGTLKIPVREFVNYTSRKFEAEEPWFPSRKGDWVLLNNKSYGEVVTQTPEYVVIKDLHATKTYTVNDYLMQNPKNLSLEGFTLLITFGLDYQHQKEITSSIREQLEADLINGLRKAGLFKKVKEFQVVFEKAGTSSLDFVIDAYFDGEAANQYLEIPRLLQQLAVESCNKHAWVIPFEQLSVHMIEQRS